MKKLSIEEKAKAYDEAKDIMEKYLKSGNAGVIAENTIKKAFPELAESEDKQIMKEIAEFIYNSAFKPKDINKKEKWLTWLEKQNSNVDNANKEYWRGYREGKLEIIHKYAEFEKQDEQNLIMAKSPQLGNQKDAWSKEDEKIYSRIYDLIHSAAYANYEVDEDGKELGEYAKIANWFKSIRSQSQWKPSDEQMKLLREVQQALLGKDCHNRFVNFMYELKRLRED